MGEVPLFQGGAPDGAGRRARGGWVREALVLEGLKLKLGGKQTLFPFLLLEVDDQNNLFLYLEIGLAGPL